jgi:hypothetical protein
MKPPRQDVYGYFDSPGQITPAHDPGAAGLCPVCAHAVGHHSIDNPLTTVSLCLEAPELRKRSYFFRAHCRCWDRATDHDKGLIESACIDSITPCRGTRQIQTTESPRRVAETR